jgi:hypothetical protein
MVTLVRTSTPPVLPRRDESTYSFGEEPVETWRTPEGAGGSTELDGLGCVAGALRREET